MIAPMIQALLYYKLSISLRAVHEGPYAGGIASVEDRTMVWYS
jgi:hypothetical protein